MFPPTIIRGLAFLRNQEPKTAPKFPIRTFIFNVTQLAARQALTVDWCFLFFFSLTSASGRARMFRLSPSPNHPAQFVLTAYPSHGTTTRASKLSRWASRIANTADPANRRHGVTDAACTFAVSRLIFAVRAVQLVWECVGLLTLAALPDDRAAGCGCHWTRDSNPKSIS